MGDGKTDSLGWKVVLFFLPLLQLGKVCGTEILLWMELLFNEHGCSK